MIFSTGAARGCHCCASFSPAPCTATPEDGSRGSDVLFFVFRVQSRPILLSAPGHGDGEGNLLARHYLASPGTTMDHLDPGYVNRTTEGYRRYFQHACFIPMVGMEKRGTY